MRKRKLIKPIILLISIIVVLCLAIGGTFAYIVATDDPVSITFVPPIIQGTLGESNGTFTVLSNSNINVYARIIIKANWVKDGAIYTDTPITESDYFVAFDPTYWTQIGNCYYYNSELEPNERTIGLTVVQTGVAPEGCEFHVEASAEVLPSQSTDAVYNSWGFVPHGN